MQGMDKELSLLRAGLFEIDNDGRIWRVAKRHGRGVKKGGGYHKGAKTSPCKRVRAEYSQRQGYLLVTATIDGQRLVTGAHRLVWVHSHGAIPCGLTINHKNGDKADNRLSNLELATMSQQRRHAIEVLNVNRNRPQGSKHPKTKLREADVLRMRDLRASGVMVKDIAEMYDMRPRAVSAICTRRTWKHI
jgi:hypothetical protein